MTNGQIRMRCPFRELHVDGKGGDSMHLSPNINAYHCFSCGSHGNLARLLLQKYDVGYFEAMEAIVEYAGVVEKGFVPKARESFELEKPWKLKPPKEYLERGFTEDVLRYFSVGVTDDKWTAIPFFFGYDLRGVQYRKVRGGKRELRNTTGFDKKHFIYNYDPKKEEAVLVEGYSDVWKLWMFEDHAEALLGASISEEQAEMLSKHTRLYVAADNDEAGMKLVEKINYRMSSYSTELLFVPYEADDPGALRSRKAWYRAKKAATSYAEYAVEMALHYEGYLTMREQVLRAFR